MRATAPILALCAATAACGAPDPVPVRAAAAQEGVDAVQRIQPPASVGAAEVAGMWLYFPTDGRAGAPASREPGQPTAYREALARRFGAVPAATLASAPGHARWGAAPAGGDLPLVLFAPGAGMGGRDYRLLIEAIAGRGYVVAMLDPLGSPAVSDARYSEVADRFAAAVARLRAHSGWRERIDFARIALIGHSIGGAGAVLGLSRVAQARAAVNLDGDYSAGALAPAPARPILYITGATEGEAEASIARRSKAWALVRGSNAAAVAVALPALRHFDFADAAVLPAGIFAEDRRRNRFGPLAGDRSFVRDLVVTFLDATLKGQGDFPAVRDAALARAGR